MRCFKNGRSANPKRGALFVAAVLASAASAAAQPRGGAGDRGENMRMPNVSIEGERQTPDIFFVFPTGKGGNVSAPRFRDYGPDILDPVVKPWFERDEMVTPQAMQAAANRSFDWDEALKSSPPPAPAPAAAAPPPLPPAREPQPNVSLPPPSIPSQAFSLPRTTAPQPPPPAAAPPPAAQPYYPSAPRSAYPPPPAPSQPSTSGSVPILVPPQ